MLKYYRPETWMLIMNNLVVSHVVTAPQLHAWRCLLAEQSLSRWLKIWELLSLQLCPSPTSPSCFFFSFLFGHNEENASLQVSVVLLLLASLLKLPVTSYGWLSEKKSHEVHVAKSGVRHWPWFIAVYRKKKHWLQSPCLTAHDTN